MEVREDIIGTAEVRDVFRSSKFGAVAGCMVTEGSVKRSKPIRVLRDNVVIFEASWSRCVASRSWSTKCATAWSAVSRSSSTTT
jgi:Translation initiation factor 2 (IF-2; GTPase)